MFIAQGPPPDPESIRALVIAIAVAVVVFWRIALRILIIGAIVLVAVGALEAVQGLR
jgi:hypothetical protein